MEQANNPQENTQIIEDDDKDELEKELKLAQQQESQNNYGYQKALRNDIPPYPTDSQAGLIANINYYLKEYLKENQKLPIFIAIVNLFRIKNYENLEYDFVINTLIHDFTRRRKRFKFSPKSTNHKKLGNILTEFRVELDSEIDNNECIDIMISTIDQKKIIVLDFHKVLDFFLEIQRSKKPKRHYTKRKKKPEEEKEKENGEKRILQEIENLKNGKNLDGTYEMSLSKIGFKNLPVNRGLEPRPELPEIFNKKLHDERLSKTDDDDKFEEVIKKSKAYTDGLNKTKKELDELENKIKDLNSKIMDMSKSKKNYHDINTLIQENQNEINGFYNAMKNKLEDFKNSNFIEKEECDNHKKVFFENKNKYLNSINRIKENLPSLIQEEENMDKKRIELDYKFENIKKYFNKIVGAEKSEMDELFEKYNINFDFYNDINLDEIEKDYIDKAERLIKELNEVEENNKNAFMEI